MMKALVLSLSNYERDGRLRALVDIFCYFSEVSILTKYTSRESALRKDVKFIRLNIVSSLQSVAYIISYVKNSGSSDLIVIDNRKAALLALLIYPIIRKKKIIYDMREFYRCTRGNSLRNQLGTFFESLLIKLADIVLCANEQRARLVKVYYDLKARPISLENNRKIGGGLTDEAKAASAEVTNNLRKAILGMTQDSNRLNFVSTDGFLLNRKAVDIINTCAQYPDQINLFIFGVNQVGGLKYIADNELKNIFHLGSVDAAVLNELLTLMDVGFVLYGDNDLNNKYCASGKIFEFIHQGIPVVTSDNVPLRSLTRRGIGVSTKDLKYGVDKVIANFQYYRDQCIRFSKERDVDVFEREVAEMILKELGEAAR